MDLSGTTLVIHPALENYFLFLVFREIADVDPWNRHRETSL
jgi:hypothetical protein